MTALHHFADAFVREAAPHAAGPNLPRPDERPGRLAAFQQRLGLRQASISGKVRAFALSFTLILVLLGAILGLALATLSNRSDATAVTASRAMAASQLATSIAQSRYFASRFAMSGDPEMIAGAFATLAGARREIDATIALEGGDEASREQMEWLATQVEGFEPELRALQASVRTHGPSATGTALADAIDISGSQLADQAARIEAELTERSRASQATLETIKATTIIVALALILGCILLAHLGARSLARQVAGSLGEITGAMTRLAEGNRTIAIPGTEREDEIGEMSRALVVFRESADALADLQRQAREEQNRVLRRLVDRFQSGVGEVAEDVSAASRQLQSTSSDMAGAATQTIGFVDEVSRTMSNTQMGVTAAAAAGDQFAMSIAEIGRQAGHSALMVQAARNSTEIADTRMDELAAAAEAIGAVVDLIGSIADRTNLLALNASIEAARGGEAGRGFAVVASEVKELARQTREATADVAARITGMQVMTRESATALAAIGERIREVELTATAIAQAVDEQSVSSRELARNLDLAASGVETIGTSIVQIAAMARTTGASADQVLTSASGLDSCARDLSARSHEFVESVRAA